MIISASFLSDTIKPSELIKKYNKTEVDYIHVDIMDGKFVENKTYTFGEIQKYTSGITKPLDVHLMVKTPEKYIKQYASLNTEYITFHYESTKKHEQLIDLIQGYGLKAGISINPNTNVNCILPLLEKLDLVLIMGVTPGASGQKFMESVLYKIEVLKKTIEEKKLRTIISVDGGINREVASLVKEKGASMICCASFLYNGNIEENVNVLKEI